MIKEHILDIIYHICTKHNIIFSFFQKNDYNSRAIKINLFFVNFAFYVTVNAVFFDKDKLHNIYINKGQFDFIYEIPKIMYSSLISIGLNALFKLLALTNNTIIQFKNYKEHNKKYIKKGEESVKSAIKIKTITFFIFGLITLLFCWYYLCAFCVIYPNTVFHLFKDSIISYAVSLLYPFVVYLLPVVFRIYALKSKIRKDRELCYVISTILQLF